MLAISVLSRSAMHASALPAGSTLDLLRVKPATPETVLRALTPLAPRVFA